MAIPRQTTTKAQTLLVLTIAWGAFAFGAVYPWAYWPLTVASALVALLWIPQAATLQTLPPSLVLAFCLVASGIAFQLVPLPLGAVASWSPETVRALREVNLLVGANALGRHALSLDPSLTIRGLALFSVDAVLLIACASLFSVRGARAFAEAVTVVGVGLALVGIVQTPLYAGRIYGFWAPQGHGDVFGPFVNKNHFAGWMLMALPLTLGLICAHTARGWRGVKPGWRDRLLWLSSADANRLMLLALAAAVMALALVLTMSRSGMSACALSIAITGAFVVRRHRGARRSAMVVFLALLVVLIAGWIGTDTIAARFSTADWDEINGRRGAWSDAVAIAGDFPLFGTGLNTYGLATMLYQRHDLQRHYSQAHNDYLQLAAEGGAILVVPAAIAFCIFVATVWRRFSDETSDTSYWLRVGAVTGMIAIALQETVDFSLQMPGNATLFAALGGIALHTAPGRRR